MDITHLGLSEQLQLANTVLAIQRCDRQVVVFLWRGKNELKHGATCDSCNWWLWSYGMGDGLTYSCSKFAGLCVSPIVKRSLCLLHETPQY